MTSGSLTFVSFVITMHANLDVVTKCAIYVEPKNTGSQQEYIGYKM